MRRSSNAAAEGETAARLPRLPAGEGRSLPPDIVVSVVVVAAADGP